MSGLVTAATAGPFESLSCIASSTVELLAAAGFTQMTPVQVRSPPVFPDQTSDSTMRNPSKTSANPMTLAAPTPPHDTRTHTHAQKGPVYYRG